MGEWERQAGASQGAPGSTLLASSREDELSVGPSLVNSLCGLGLSFFFFLSLFRPLFPIKWEELWYLL